MIIDRDIEGFVTYCASKFPVLTITGPRQSGKSTLAKKLFPQGKYVTLEDPDTLEQALRDSRGFLSSLGEGTVIIDEAQNCPTLFSYIQTIVDNRKANAQFVLTGSQNFLMLEKISQSLAGRVAIIRLLPFSIDEISRCTAQCSEANVLIWRGGYPPIYDRDIDPSIWVRSYITTYLERDVRNILRVSDLSKFQIFMKLCAGRIGQLVNLNSLATEAGVTNHTIKSWLSILEASYILYTHPPHFKNFNKRLAKQTKLYFYDTAIACALLGIKDPEQLFSHYMKGALFENFIITELIKSRFNKGKENNLYFWRDSHGHEVDVLVDNGAELVPIEIKSTQTFSGSLLKTLQYWLDMAHQDNGYLVYQGDKSFTVNGCKVTSWHDIADIPQT